MHATSSRQICTDKYIDIIEVPTVNNGQLNSDCPFSDVKIENCSQDPNPVVAIGAGAGGVVG